MGEIETIEWKWVDYGSTNINTNNGTEAIARFSKEQNRSSSPQNC